MTQTTAAPPASGVETGYSGSSVRFLHLSGGKLVERVDKDTPGATKRTPKPRTDGTQPDDVYEMHYEAVSGIIEGINYRERTVNFTGEDEVRRSTVALIRGGDQLWSVELEQNQRYWSSFLIALPNADLSRWIRLSPYCFTPKGETHDIIGMNLYQMPTPEQVEAGVKIMKDGTTKVMPRYTKENPGKMPDVPLVRDAAGKPLLVKGKVVYDWSARDEFLFMIAEHFGNKLRAEQEALMGAAEQAAIAEQEAIPEPAPVAAPPTNPNPVKPRADHPPIGGQPGGPQYQRPTQADPFPVQPPIDESDPLPF